MSSVQPAVERFREHRACNTPDLSRALEGTDQFARVVSLHDGDTLTAVFGALGGFFKVNVRVDGIDAPEMNAHADANRKVARMARDRMVELVVGDPRRVRDALGAERGGGRIGSADKDDRERIDALLDGDVFLVRIRCGRCEKYGRLLGKVSSAYSDSLSPTFGDILVAEHLALEYRGGHKPTEAEQMRELGRDEQTGELVDGSARRRETTPEREAQAVDHEHEHEHQQAGFWRQGNRVGFSGWFPFVRMSSNG